MPIKEFREFFLRAISVNSGSKRDQEVGFPTKTSVNDCCNGTKSVGNRFLADHFATDACRLKFFESITFKLNPEDTATTDIQGLVKRATDQECAEFEEPTVFTKTVLPYQLPQVVGTSVTVAYLDLTTLGFHTTINDAVASGNPFRTIYIVTGGAGTCNGGQTILLVNDFTGYGCDNTTSDLSFYDYTLDNTKFMTNDGDKIEIVSMFENIDACWIKFWFNTTEIFALETDPGTHVIRMEISRVDDTNIHVSTFGNSSAVGNDLFTDDFFTVSSIATGVVIDVVGDDVANDNDLMLQKFELKCYNI